MMGNNLQLEIGDILLYHNYPAKNPENQKTQWFLILHASALPLMLRLTTQPSEHLLHIPKTLAKCLNKDSYINPSYIQNSIPLAVLNTANTEHFKGCFPFAQVRAVINRLKDEIPDVKLKEIREKIK